MFLRPKKFIWSGGDKAGQNDPSFVRGATGEQNTNRK